MKFLPWLREGPLWSGYPSTSQITHRTTLPLICSSPNTLAPHRFSSNISMWFISSSSSSPCLNVPLLIRPNLTLIFTRSAPFPSAGSLACLVLLTFLSLYPLMLYVRIYFIIYIMCFYCLSGFSTEILAPHRQFVSSWIFPSTEKIRKEKLIHGKNPIKESREGKDWRETNKSEYLKYNIYIYMTYLPDFYKIVW